MLLKYLKLNNFKSFTNTEIDFTSILGSTLVLGENRDNQGQDSNGAGKTSIFEAISYALFGKTPKNIAVDDIIQTNKDQCIIELCIQNGKDELLIKRYRGKNNDLAYWVNGSDDHPKSTMTSTQNALLGYLGINPSNNQYYNDFLNTTYFSIDVLKSFAGKQTTSEERMKLVSRFLNLGLLEASAKLARDYAKRYETDMIRISSQKEVLENITKNIPSLEKIEEDYKENLLDIGKCNSNLEVYKKDLKSFEEVKNKIKELEHLNQKKQSVEKNKCVFIESIAREYKQKENEIKTYLDLDTKKKQLKEELAGIKNIESIDQILKELNDEYEELSDEINKLIVKNSQLDTKVTEQTSLLKRAYICPDCNSNLMLSDNKLKHFDLEEATSVLGDYKEKLRKSKVSLANKETKKDEYKTKIKEVTQAKQTKDLLILKIQEIEKSIKDISVLEKELNGLKEKRISKEKEYAEEISGVETEITNLKQDISSLGDYESKIRGLNDKIKIEESKLYDCNVVKGKLNSYKETLIRNSEEIISLQKTGEVVSQNVKNYKFMIDCFATIRRWKIETFIPEFQNITNNYLAKLKCGMQIELQTLKEKKSAKADENKYKVDFSIQVIDENGYNRDFETFSDGESARIAICIGLALRDIVKNRSGFGFEFLLMDQFLDGVDDNGAYEIVDMLNRSQGQNLIISHTDNLQKLFNNHIKVIKENKESRIEQ